MNYTLNHFSNINLIIKNIIKHINNLIMLSLLIHVT